MVRVDNASRVGFAMAIAIAIASIVVASARNPCEDDDDSSSSKVCANLGNSHTRSHNSCKLYMAPTTVGGIEGNYGMFTAVDLPAKATVFANDGPNIPVLLDDRKTSKLYPEKDHLGLFDNVWWGLNEIVSDQLKNEMSFLDSSFVGLVDLQINFGAMPNCHPYRSNLEIRQPPTRIYDDRTYLSAPPRDGSNGNGNDHVRNPLRGSFSYYTGKHVMTEIPVKAGTELFWDYSNDWEQHGFPRTQDYFSAAALVRKWILVVEKHKKTNNTHNDKNETLPKTVIDGARAMLELILVSSPTTPLDLDDEYYKKEDHITKGVYELEQLTSRILSLVPQNTEDWHKVYDRSWELFAKRRSGVNASIASATASAVPPGIPSIQDVADAMFEVSQPPPKSIQELEETGICLDHIVAGVSKIPLETDPTTASKTLTVGRGAMAARFLAAGELIVPVPLLHLLDRALFDRVPEDELDDGDLSFDALVTNYCFGHSESTILLCPLTNAVLINHCSDRNGRFPCGSTDNHNAGLGPNAVVRWAIDAEWDRKTRTTLTMTLDDLAGGDYHQQHRMMSMEIVATRDIQEGEEIFIDYGEPWEKAWLEHLRNWSKDDGDEGKDESIDEGWSSPLTVFELNRYGVMDGKEDNEDPIFFGDMRSPRSAMSEDERFTAMCWYQDVFLSDEAELGSRHRNTTKTGEDDDDTIVDWEDLSDEDIIEQYAINVGNDRSILFTHFRELPPGSTDHFWPCTIVSKHDPLDDDDEDRYLVRIYPSGYHEHEKYDEESYEMIAKNVLLKNYPRSSIHFMVLPYEGDQYHPKAFRHHIEIPDEIFPEQWKNKKETKLVTNNEKPS